ncbi:MAG: MBL fold metallo-hydrolase RNA specificity domain-containing protein [Candidatus Hodarchaeota archaeon]
MEIEILGGVKEIGGNKVFINVGKKKFLFDFGLSFKESRQYFSEFLSPRKFNGIIDYLYLNLIPPLNHFYRNDLIIPFKEKLRKDPYRITPSDQNIVDACFLTHAHMDHYKFIGFLKKNTPIYMNWISQAIIDYLVETTTDSLLPEVLKFYEFFKIVPKKTQSKNGKVEYKRANKNDYKKKETQRNIITMENEKPYYFQSIEGEIVITQYQTDHSIPGACSYIIEKNGESIIYTGDFRKHGFHSEWVDHFIQKARNSNPKAIITEGTRVSSIPEFKDGSYKDDDQSEEEVLIRSQEIIRNHSGLILVNFPSRNLDRILLYYKLAKESNRIFAVHPKIFMMINSFRKNFDDINEDQIKIFNRAYEFPEENDEYFVVYLQRKGWGQFNSADYIGYHKKIFKDKKFLNCYDIIKVPERYLVYLDYFMLGELIDLDQKPETVLFLNSTTDPFNEEMAMQDERLNSWLERFGILKTETIHSSGHCNVDDLIELLQKVDADNVIPIHTEHPETFEEFGLSSKIILPEEGIKYIF